MDATIFNSEVKKFINTDADVRKLTGDCLFTEGPLWNPAGYYLFSDITANCIYKIDAEGSKEVFFQNSGCAEPNDLLQQDMIGSNGLAYDRNGNLLVCQHGNHAISSFTNGALVPLISEFGGKPLNSPNDLIVHHDGRIFFSDPPYGLKNGELNSLNFQDRAGIYCWRGGELLLVTDQYQYPNGVCLSTDQQKLYACSNKPFEKFVLEINTIDFSARVLCEENGDGIETDDYGNLYLCSRDGIVVVDKHGERLALIRFETIPANLCWGGETGSDLLVTARQNVFFIKDFRKRLN